MVRKSGAPLRPVGGLFYRIVPEARWREGEALESAMMPEGRFHHDGERALYVSSRPDWAGEAIKAYVRPQDPPRVICELEIEGARVLDLREASDCAAWGVDPALAAIPWLPELAEDRKVSSWQVSDLARAGGADGLIYQARSAPERWHLVLFNWTLPPVVARLSGRVLPFAPGQALLRRGRPQVR